MTTTNGMVVHGSNGAGHAVAKASEETRAFEPRDIREAVEMAKLLVASGLMPRGVQRPESAFAIIATGRELGLTAMQSIRSIHIIEGKPTLSADLVCALVKSRSDVCTYFRLVESTDKIARYETQRRGEPAPTTMSFSIEDAQRAGVTSKDNWRKYPAAMLRARCITALARAVYPDLAMGIYDPDEVQDVVPAGPAQGPLSPPATTPSAPGPAGSGTREMVQELGDARVMQELCDRIDAAESGPALNAIARAAAKAFKDLLLSDNDMAAIKTAVQLKRSIIGAPKPPKSAPRRDDDPPPDDAGDAYEANEAEAEAMHAQYDQ